MPAPSPLAIATSSVRRLVKEEASYHAELEKQEARLKKTEESAKIGGEGNENAEWTVGQEKRAIEETRNVFPALKERIRDAVAKLQDLVEEEGEGGDEKEVQEARKVLEMAKSSAE